MVVPGTAYFTLWHRSVYRCIHPKLGQNARWLHPSTQVSKSRFVASLRYRHALGKGVLMPGAM
jgi:hypothetical protein